MLPEARLEDIYGSLDANHDGSLSLEEFKKKEEIFDWTYVTEGEMKISKAMRQVLQQAFEDDEYGDDLQAKMDEAIRKAQGNDDKDANEAKPGKNGTEETPGAAKDTNNNKQK